MHVRFGHYWLTHHSELPKLAQTLYAAAYPIVEIDPLYDHRMRGLPFFLSTEIGSTKAGQHYAKIWYRDFGSDGKQWPLNQWVQAAPQSVNEAVIFLKHAINVCSQKETRRNFQILTQQPWFKDRYYPQNGERLSDSFIWRQMVNQTCRFFKLPDVFDLKAEVMGPLNGKPHRSGGLWRVFQKKT